MKYSRLYKAFGIAIVLFVAAGALMMMRSFRFNPDPSGDFEFMARAQQKLAPGIKVSASALGASESQRSFGENLAKHGIQSVWLSIENETDDQLVYIPIVMTRNTTRLTRFPIGSTALYLSPRTVRATHFFSSVKCQISCHLTPILPALCTACSMRE